MKILAFTLALLTATAVLLSCADLTDSPAASSDATTVTTAVITPATTVDRDKLTLSDLSEDETAFIQLIWNFRKDSAQDSMTINNIRIGDFLYRTDDFFVGTFFGFEDKENGVLLTSFPGNLESYDLGGYNFKVRPCCYPLRVFFKDGSHYSLIDAYTKGAINDTQLKDIWEAYEAAHSAG